MLNVGPLFAFVVCTVAVLLDVLPIVVDPLNVVNTNVPVKDGFEGIAFESAVRCAAVNVIVLSDVPVLLCAGIVIVVTSVEPFLISSL